MSQPSSSSPPGISERRAGRAPASAPPAPRALPLWLSVAAVFAAMFSACTVEQRQWLQPDYCEVHVDCEVAEVCVDYVCLPDQDRDYLPDISDECPLDPTNDHDGDGQCDDVSSCIDSGLDLDADGVCQADDNCPRVANADQADDDGDGQGNDCDPCPADAPNDTDADGICDSDDACPSGGCALAGACSSAGDCAHGVCSEGICTPVAMRRVELDGTELWAAVGPLTAADAGAVGMSASPTEAGTPLRGISWHQAVWLANSLSTARDLTPCYELTGCSGQPDQICQAQHCVSDYACAEVAVIDGCSGLRLPTLAEWTSEHALPAANDVEPPAAELVMLADDRPACVDLSLVGGSACAGVGAADHARGQVSEWVWDEHRMRFGRSRRLALGDNWRASAVDLQRLDSWAYRAVTQTDYIGVRYVWDGGAR